MSVSPVMAPATAQEAGRNCPYCRFPLKEGAATARCGSCHAAHHSDCWADNRGCAVMGCAGAPAAVGGQMPTPAALNVAAPPPPLPQPEVTLTQPAAYQPPPPAAVPPPVAPVPPPAPAPGGGGRWLVGTILVLALVIAGAAIAIVLTRKDDPAPTRAASASTAVPDETIEPVPTPEETFTPEPASYFEGMSKAQVRSDIQDLLLTWHQDIVAGDFDSAWEALSDRKRDQIVNDPEGGYDLWESNQRKLAQYLDPDRLRVSIDGLEKDEVVRVRVSGMRYSGKPGVCRTWDGLTWVQYDGAEFKYDPGYSVPGTGREPKWKPRLPELLGGNCA